MTIKRGNTPKQLRGNRQQRIRRRFQDGGGPPDGISEEEWNRLGEEMRLMQEALAQRPRVNRYGEGVGHSVSRPTNMPRAGDTENRLATEEPQVRRRTNVIDRAIDRTQGALGEAARRGRMAGENFGTAWRNTHDPTYVIRQARRELSNPNLDPAARSYWERRRAWAAQRLSPEEGRRELGNDPRNFKDGRGRKRSRTPVMKDGEINWSEFYRRYRDNPEERKKRVDRQKARRQLEREGRVSKGDGKHVDHKDGNTGNNSNKNLRVQDAKASRNQSRKGRRRNYRKRG